MAFPVIAPGILIPSLQFAMDTMTDLSLEFINGQAYTGNQVLQAILNARNNPAQGVFPVPLPVVIQATRNILIWAYLQVPLPHFFAQANIVNNNLGDNFAQQIHALIVQHLPQPLPPPPPQLPSQAVGGIRRKRQPKHSKFFY